MNAAVQEQGKRKLEEEVRQVLQTAIDSNDANLLKNAIGRAQAVGLATTDEDFAKARSALKDLQAQSLYRCLLAKIHLLDKKSKLHLGEADRLTTRMKKNITK